MIRQWERSDWQGEQTFAWSFAGHSLARHPDLLAVLAAVNDGRVKALTGTAGGSKTGSAS